MVEMVYTPRLKRGPARDAGSTPAGGTRTAKEVPLTIGFLFWLFMVLWLVFGVWRGWSTGTPPSPFTWGGDILLFVLFLLLGIQVFGWPIRS